MADQPECTTNADGTKEWYLNGRLHREDGPAIEWASGSKFWYSNGKRHREDGPAIERPVGTKEWWLNGGRHRVDGPAVEWPDGVKEWWVNGKLHREDGPAVEWADGAKEWHLNDVGFSAQEYWTRTLQTKPVGTLIVGSWGSCLKLSQTSFLLYDFAQKSLTLLNGA
jgi:hypothetical protein